MPTLEEISNTLEKIKARARTLEKAVAEKVAAKKAKAHPVVAPPTTYTGPSVVDYLKSAGQPSSFTSREKLAAQHGITDYRGTAKQNIRLLSRLRTGAPPVVKPPVIAPPVVKPPAVAPEGEPVAPEKESIEGEIRIIGGKRKIYRPWGEWEEVTPGEEAWQKAGGIAPPEWKPIVTGGIAPSEWKPIVTTKEITPTTPTELSDTELYDIKKIQSNLTDASTSKKAAYNELIRLQSKQYDTEYNKAGLGELKTKVAGVDSDITDEKRVRDESIDKVRRNPYYSAATITGEVAEIERKIGRAHV